VIEVEYYAQDVYRALDIPSTSGAVVLSRVVPVGGGEYLLYGSATADVRSIADSLVDAMPYWEDLTFIDCEDDWWTFEIRICDDPVVSTLALEGGTIAKTEIRDGEAHMTHHLPPSADVGRLIETVRETYPWLDLVKRSQVTRETARDHPTPRDLTANLTKRQRSALEAAFYAGYFQWPRNTTGEEVADALGIASPTFHQHLRKAEQKIFSALLSPPATGVSV
jgi:hypothetical protein